jgi:hypothetical protein
MISRITYLNAVDALQSRIPSFTSIRNTDESFISPGDDDPYLVFADFYRFVFDKLNSQMKGEEDEEILQLSFSLLDEMLTSSDPELVNVAQVAVFEPLADHPSTLAVAKGYLSEEANHTLEEWLQKWLA